MTDADPDQAAYWAVEPSKPYELAAWGLLIFSGVSGVALVIYALGGFLGAW